MRRAPQEPTPHNRIRSLQNQEPAPEGSTAAAPDGVSESGTNPPPPTGPTQIRTLTVMLTDMADSTAFAEQFGARAAFDKRRTHNALLVPLIARCHGRLVEIVGDSLLAVFATASDAAECALAMQRRIRRYNASDPVDVPALEIHVRIALHTGKVLLHREGPRLSIVGRAVNVAARIEASDVCTADRIIVSEATWRAIEYRAAFRDAVVRTIAGKGVGPVNVLELKLQPSPSRLDPGPTADSPGNRILRF